MAGMICSACDRAITVALAPSECGIGCSAGIPMLAASMTQEAAHMGMAEKRARLSSCPAFPALRSEICLIWRHVRRSGGGGGVGGGGMGGGTGGALGGESRIETNTD